MYTGTPEGFDPVNTGDVLEGTIESVGAIRLTLGPAE
jgi:2-keto-4-pentenoate hydratase/2-oxohepta-3-ene-1,7-dioic acid hydratase in catechol pathway